MISQSSVTAQVAELQVSEIHRLYGWMRKVRRMMPSMENVLLLLIGWLLTAASPGTDGVDELLIVDGSLSAPCAFSFFINPCSQVPSCIISDVLRLPNLNNSRLIFLEVMLSGKLLSTLILSNVHSSQGLLVGIPRFVKVLEAKGSQVFVIQPQSIYRQ